MKMGGKAKDSTDGTESKNENHGTRSDPSNDLGQHHCWVRACLQHEHLAAKSVSHGVFGGFHQNRRKCSGCLPLVVHGLESFGAQLT